DADRQVQYGRPRAEAVLDHADAHVEIGTGPVELVDEAHPRNLVLLRLPPDRLGLRLDAGNAVETGDRAVEHAQATLDLDGEVDVAGGVDDVDPVLGPITRGPEAGRRRGRDRDPALLLLLHPVHGRGALMDLADLVGLAGIIEDALGRRRLAGVDVRHDADIAIAFERMAAGHFHKFLSDVGSRRIRLPQI